MIREDMRIDCAATGAAGVDMARSQSYELIVLDLRLPDMHGLTVLGRLRAAQIEAPPVLILSGFADVESAHVAGRLGAAAVLEKPIFVVELLEAMRRVVLQHASRTIRPLHGRRVLTDDGFVASVLATGAPGSVAERWAVSVWKTRESPGDFRTLSQWARFVGVSGSALKESCRLLGIRPYDARDLARVLRALVRARHYRCRPEALLDVSDSRTIKSLFGRAGIDAAQPPISLDVLFAQQQFVPAANEGLEVLRALAAQSGESNQAG
jgi:CheY-like chemotaxis protein